MDLSAPPEGLLLVHDKVGMAHSLEMRFRTWTGGVGLRAVSAFFHEDAKRQENTFCRCFTVICPEIAGRRKYGLHFPMLARPSGVFPAFIRETLLGGLRKPELFHRGRWSPGWRRPAASSRHGARLACSRPWPSGRTASCKYPPADQGSNVCRCGDLRPRRGLKMAFSRRHFFYGTLLAGAIPAAGFGSVASLKPRGTNPRTKN